MQGGLIGERSREQRVRLAGRLDVEAFEPIGLAVIEPALDPDLEYPAARLPSHPPWIFHAWNIGQALRAGEHTKVWF